MLPTPEADKRFDPSAMNLTQVGDPRLSRGILTLPLGRFHHGVTDELGTHLSTCNIAPEERVLGCAASKSAQRSARCSQV